MEWLFLVHSWYSQECCGGKDCHPVPCSEISRVNGGYNWIRGPGDVVFFTKERMHPSEDGDCHVCVVTDVSPAGICVYLAPRT